LLKMPLGGFKALSGAPPTAHGIEVLFAIMVQGTEEHPALQAVEAITLLTRITTGIGESVASQGLGVVGPGLCGLPRILLLRLYEKASNAS
jgi:hypothetical protein